MPFWYSGSILCIFSQWKNHNRPTDLLIESWVTTNKAIYTEGVVACCWAGAVTILYTWHQALARSLLIVFIAQIVLLCQFGLFSDQFPTDGPTDKAAYRVTCTRLKTAHQEWDILVKSNFPLYLIVSQDSLHFITGAVGVIRTRL